jgi:serine/threonine protein kinase
VSLKELQLPSIASLRAIAALKSPHLALVRPARIGLGFESAGANQKTLLEVERVLGGPGRLSLPYSLRWLLDVMTGLGVLHRTLGFVHGEVQPEHVVLGEDGVGRLIPVVRAHWVRGEQRAPERLYYLAPEKLLGDRVDVRSDVFSVGVMLWEALAGQALLEAHEVADIIARLMGGGIPRVHAPEGEAWTEPLAAIAERAIAVDPGRRYATVGEMKDVLQACCSRYLASPPGMAELFKNPEKRSRSHARESIAPESQRVTLPPDQAAAGPTKPPPLDGAHEAALDVAAARLSLASYSSFDLEEEMTTKPFAAPVPVVSRAKHIQTLLGVPPPFIERESSPDAITQPFARIPASAPVIITPLPIPKPATSRPPPVRRSLTPAGPPAHLIDVRSAPPPPVSGPVDSPRAASLSPFVAAKPSEAPPSIAEPSFELVRPRKSRAAWWLLLGAAAAIGAFAARPWLARQVAAATGGFPDNAASNADLSTDLPPAQATTSTIRDPEGTASTSARVVVGIASTPAVPSASTAQPPRGVVLRDRVPPRVNQPVAPVPRQPELPAAPAAPPPPPAAPPPTPKPKSVPVSDADEYGI